MDCSICQGHIPMEPNGWMEGNNAQPVNDGRCCNLCNWTDVIPARLGLPRREGDFSLEAWNENKKELINQMVFVPLKDKRSGKTHLARFYSNN